MKLKRSVLVAMIIILAAANAVTLLFYFNKDGAGKGSAAPAGSETAATIGEEHISRESWMYEMEKRYGKEVLREIINQKVIDQLAARYDIEVTEEEIEREITLIKSVFNSYDEDLSDSDEVLKERVRMELLLEKIVTKDVDIPVQEVERYYTENKDQYSIPEMFNLSQIVAESEEEADLIAKELADGSSFAALAMERSKDDVSAVQGGNIGYIPAGSHILAGDLAERIEALNKGEVSEVMESGGEFYIFQLNDKVEAKNYALDEVKEQIHRRLAMEQVESPVKPEDFWKELDVDWFYEGSF